MSGLILKTGIEELHTWLIHASELADRESWFFPTARLTETCGAFIVENGASIELLEIYRFQLSSQAIDPNG